MIGVELGYFLEVGGAPHDSHPYPILVFSSPSPSPCWMILSAWSPILPFPNVWLPILAACPFEWHIYRSYFILVQLEFAFHEFSQHYLDFHDLTTIVGSYKLHTGPIKKIAKFLTINDFARNAHLPYTFPVCFEHVKLLLPLLLWNVYIIMTSYYYLWTELLFERWYNLLWCVWWSWTLRPFGC